MWRASIFTLYPDMFPGPLGTSLSGDALSRGTWSLETHQIREHGLRSLVGVVELSGARGEAADLRRRRQAPRRRLALARAAGSGGARAKAGGGLWLRLQAV